MEPEGLYLTEHTYLCADERYYVFLDLKTDRYLCTTRAQLDPIVQGLPRLEAHESQTVSATGQEKTELIISELIHKGILSRSGGKPFTTTVSAEPIVKQQQPAKDPTLVVRAYHALCFLRAAAKASSLLRHQPIELTVKRVTDRKKAAKRCRAVPGFRNDRREALVSVFSALRPYFPRAYLCLYDSLALLEFLASYRLYPDWVFGVRVDPFEAHCWVQDETVVLNDTIERVSTYIPIMRI